MELTVHNRRSFSNSAYNSSKKKKSSEVSVHHALQSLLQFSYGYCQQTLFDITFHMNETIKIHCKSLHGIITLHFKANKDILQQIPLESIWIFYTIMFYLIVTSSNIYEPTPEGCLCEPLGLLLPSAWVSRVQGAPWVHTRAKAPTYSLDVCKQRKPYPQKSLIILVINRSCERKRLCVPVKVDVRMSVRFQLFGISYRTAFKICRCFLTFLKHLVFWFISSIADVDLKYIVH